MLNYPSDVTGSLLTWAEYYFSLGMTPLPADSRSKRPKKPLVEYGELRGQQATWPDVTSLFFSRPSADSLGVILPQGVTVVDCDGPEGAEWIAQRPLPRDCPRARTQRGFHLWLSAPPVNADKVKLAEKVDLLCAGHFCLVQPSPGKAWERRLSLPLPAAPAWLVEAASVACPTGPAQRHADDSTDAELAAASLAAELADYSGILPDLEWDGHTGAARCPLHDDETPSLSLYMRAGIASRIYWRCHAECDGSFVGVRKGKGRHGGNLNDLKRLLRQMDGTEEYDRARAFVNTLQCSDFARSLILAVVNVAEERDLGLGCEVGLGYRAVARLVGCEQVIETAQRPRGYLSKNGRVVRAVIAEVAELGLLVIPGCQYSRETGRGMRTAFRVPQRWYEG